MARASASATSTSASSPPATSSVVFESTYTWGDDEWMRRLMAGSAVGVGDAGTSVVDTLRRGWVPGDPEAAALLGAAMVLVAVSLVRINRMKAALGPEGMLVDLITGGIVALAVTYLAFSDYERPAMRMAALSDRGMLTAPRPPMRL